MSKHTSLVMNIKFIFLYLLVSVWSYGNITGTVYQDYNLNGTQDAGEVGVSGMQITAVCEDGSTPSATTAANGSYTLTVATAGDKCRIEADPSSAGLGSGANAQGSAPLVDIVSDGATHNISVSSPSSYCQSNPDVAVAATPVNSSATANTSLFSIYSDFSNGALYPIQSNGYPDASSGVGTPVLATNQPQVQIDNAYTNRVALTDSTKTGGIWGLAWDRSNKKLYAGAVIRRYVNLIDNNSDGIGDVGAIYRIDPVTNTTSLLVDISEAYGGYNVQESTRDLLQSNQQDSAVTPYVGRAGLGDVDISEDGNTLYTVSLGSKELVSIPLVNPNSYTHTPIPNPYGASCPTADVRPWATKVHGSDIYIGSVCESDMTVGAAVQKYDGTNFTTVTIGNKLNYDKNGATGPTYVYSNNAYKPWSVTNRQAPIFSDIEFDNNGDMILGFIDRKSYIADSFSAVSGDIRRMCYSPGQGNNGSDYVDESTSDDLTSCTSSTTHYRDPTNFGAPFDYPEYYSGDYMGRNFVSHVENTIGGLAMKTGDNGVYSTAFDPTSVYNSGFTKFDNATGFKIGSQMITPASEKDIYARKAGGLGDIELLCDPAPIEIGNYVWEDTDGDGIQDPEEPAIPNVTVKLYDASGTLLGTATTDSSGHYYFGGANNTGGVTLSSNTNYELRINLADTSLVGKVPTTKGAGGNGAIDSDGDNGALHAGYSTIQLTTSSSNDHNFDFGFLPVAPAITVEKHTNGFDADTVGTAVVLNVGDAITWEYNVTNTGNEDLTSLVLTDDKEGTITCPSTTLAVGASVICTQPGTAVLGNYANIAEANATGATSGTPVTDTDPSHYTVPAVSLGSWTGNVSKETTQDGTGDVNLVGVTIKLFTDPNGDGNPDDGVLVGTTTTDANGNYVFNNLAFGDYVAVETQPSGLSNVSENEGGADNDKPDNGIDNSIAGRVDIGETDTHNDFVEATLGELSGNVSHEDTTGLHPIAGVTLVLIDENGNEVSRTTTDGNGDYSFTQLFPGNYIIREIQPDNYDDLRENEGGADNDGVVLTAINEISAVVGENESDILNDFVEVSKSVTLGNNRQTPTPTPTPTPRPNPVAFSNASQIADILNDSPIADAIDSREGDYFSFVAQQSGLYIFSTDVNSFTGAAIHDRNEERLNLNEFSDVGNFTIRQTLKNGERYYIRIYANQDTNYILTVDYVSINDFVERFYTDMLGRSADATGLQYWVDLLSDGVISGVDMAHGFGSSTEFINRNLNDNDYLTALYQTFFDRTPDTAGLVYWLDKLQNGVSRSEVLEGFANSKEFKEKTASYGIKFKSTLTEKFVNRLYTIGLTRYPDGSGFRYWVNGLTQGQFNARIAVTGFVFSDEFINRNLDNTSYVQTLYRMLFDRAADATGLNAWVTKLNNGETREMVLDGFLNSQEFIALAKKYGIRRK